jgi:hypothetical protein
MMAESFGLIQTNKMQFYLFLRARQVSSWIAYGPVPPPLNLLRVPYEILCAAACSSNQQSVQQHAFSTRSARVHLLCAAIVGLGVAFRERVCGPLSHSAWL